MHCTRRRCLHLGLAALLLAAGCTSGMRELRGARVTHLDHPVATVHAAVVAALEQEGLPLEQNQVDASSAKVISHYADDTGLTVLVERLTANASKLTIRAGAFGDEQRHQHLLEVIRAHLDAE